MLSPRKDHIIHNVTYARLAIMSLYFVVLSSLALFVLKGESPNVKGKTKLDKKEIMQTTTKRALIG